MIDGTVNDVQGAGAVGVNTYVTNALSDSFWANSDGESAATGGTRSEIRLVGTQCLSLGTPRSGG